MVASDRISIYDVVMPTADPRQGQGAQPDVGILVRADRRHRPQPLPLRRRAGRGRGAGDAGAQAGDVPGRVRRPRLPLGLGLEGIQGAAAPSAGSSCPPGLLESDKLPEPIFTPATKAEIGDHDENVDFERAAEIVGDRALMEELRRISIEVYQRGAEHAAERGHHPRRHQVRVRPPRRRRDRPRRRGPDARLLALLAGRPLRARRDASPPSTSSTCATGPTRAGWDHTPPAPELPPDVVEQTRAKYVEAYERITERSVLVATRPGS